MKILHVVGARPNFMKVAPVHQAIGQYPQIQQVLVHTGQHYDINMSDIFFKQLGLPAPDINLEVGSGSHAVQMAQIMTRFEEFVLKEKPDLVLVYGDVNSTVAAALVCAKLGIRVGHVEAGLRSFDRTMPEEINRLLTDQIADFLFTPSQDGDENLLREGVPGEKIHFVGNVMIDTLVRLLPIAMEKWQNRRFSLEGLSVAQERYVLVTLHRPSNVDDPKMLADIMAALADFSRDVQVIFPIHPRTRQRLSDLNLLDPKSSDQKLKFLDPVGYLDFLALQRHAKLVITDSGGIQEETTYLNVPCLTVRENTERPVTVSLGTNVLVGRDMLRLREETRRILSGKAHQGQAPPLWDGHASERIADILARVLSGAAGNGHCEYWGK
jgi:UDP-N-acetylglucosamine 2-epimerase (non-hydrolysing)